MAAAARGGVTVRTRAVPRLVTVGGQRVRTAGAKSAQAGPEPVMSAPSGGGGPLSAEQVESFLRRGFIGIAECMAGPGELERMNESYDSLFGEHMDGGHNGLVQTSVSNAPLEWVFGPQLHAKISAITLQLLAASLFEAGRPGVGTFSDGVSCGAICKPAHTGGRTELHQVDFIPLSLLPRRGHSKPNSHTPAALTTPAGGRMRVTMTKTLTTLPAG